jgi:hypothetical protein
MKLRECLICKTSTAAAETFTVNGDVLCTPCADKKVVEIQSAKGRLEVLRGKDPTVCFKCAGDFGSVELPLLAGMHACESCRVTLLNFEYPKWLKFAFVGLLALLAVSLIHGRSYFAVGRAYYQGKKLLEAGHATESAPHFRKALESGTESALVRQTAALAFLRAGLPEEANKAVAGREFAQDDLFRRLDTEFQRFQKASTAADDAFKLFQGKKYREATKLMHQAAATYPAASGLADVARQMDYATLFYEEDYDGLVTLAEKAWAGKQSYDNAAGLAGAYGCRYAVSGDPSVRQKATDMLERARTLARSKEDLDDFREWQPRLNHRLETRKIVDKEQYNALVGVAQATSNSKEESN